MRARLSLCLGYYADIMFEGYDDAFANVMHFLFSSTSYKPDTPEHVISLQSIDTLNTVVSDNDLKPRLEPFFLDLLQIIQSQVQVI